MYSHDRRPLDILWYEVAFNSAAPEELQAFYYAPDDGSCPKIRLVGKDPSLFPFMGDIFCIERDTTDMRQDLIDMRENKAKIYEEFVNSYHEAIIDSLDTK